jgi:hypothetical protein
MIATSKWLAIVGVAFVTGSFIASPELRAYAANTVGSSDIINESILSEDIKNSQVKASDIATDAVGAAELQGVTKLLFAQCGLTSTEANTSVPASLYLTVQCTISGVDSDDTAIATRDNGANNCFPIVHTQLNAGEVNVTFKNVCSSSATPGASTIALIVYDK